MTVYCEDCTHATQRQTDKLYRWLCMASPREAKEVFVKRKVTTAPYNACITVNKDGNCPMFEVLKRLENDDV